MTKYLLGDKDFPQRNLFPNEILPNMLYLTFMKVLNKFGPPAETPYQFFAVTPTDAGISAKIL